MRRTGLTMLLAWSLAACAAGRSGGDPGPSPESPDRIVRTALGDTIHLGYGQGAEVGSGGLRIRFEEVRSDSRCPRGVTCVWAGDATVRLGLTSGEGVWTLAELHTHEEPDRVLHGRHVVQLVDLQPHPVPGSSTPAEDYVALLVVRLR